MFLDCSKAWDTGMNATQRKLAERYCVTVKVRNELKKQSLAAKPIKVSQRELDAMRLIWSQLNAKAV